MRFLHYKIDKGIGVLLVLFILTLPVINPMLRSDGIGYYAYLRSLMIDGDLQFKNEWEVAKDDRVTNPDFLKDESLFQPRVNINPEYYRITETGHVPNRYSVTASILWFPFFILGHFAAMLFRLMGGDVSLDGFSKIHLYFIGLGSAIYAFLGIILCYRVAIQQFSRKTVLFSIVVIWFASSLVAYMYGHPIQSHAMAFFLISGLVFAQYQMQTRMSPVHMVLCGLILGLLFMLRPMDMLFVSLIIITLFKITLNKQITLKRGVLCLFVLGGAFAVTIIPHFVVSHILYGRLVLSFQSYALSKEALQQIIDWKWGSPHFFHVLFSSKHGLFSWTPVLIFGFLGLIAYARKEPIPGFTGIILFILYVYFLGCTKTLWDQGSSFGGRYFISFTPLFILGLCRCIEICRTFLPKILFIFLGGLFILWNIFFLIQFGLGVIPRWDYISWGTMIRNQFILVPSFMIQKIASLFAYHPELGVSGALLSLGLLTFVCLKRSSINQFFHSL